MFLWRFYSSVTLTEAKASTAQLGYWSREGNIRFMNARMKSGKRPSTMLCLTERIRVSCKENHLMNGKKKNVINIDLLQEAASSCAPLECQQPFSCTYMMRQYVWWSFGTHQSEVWFWWWSTDGTGEFNCQNHMLHICFSVIFILEKLDI